MILLDRMTALQRGGRILLDSNLLLLLTVGSFDRSLIARYKRTDTFRASDYDLLVTIVEPFTTLVTTPHILTEVSNLANSLPSSLKFDWSRHFAAQMEVFSEVREESRIVARHGLFPEFGLTDASIARLTENTLILTQDGRLAARLNAVHFCALNLSDLVRIRSDFIAGSQ
jgi:hypothetical protein